MCFTWLFIFIHTEWHLIIYFKNDLIYFVYGIIIFLVLICFSYFYTAQKFFFVYKEIFLNSQN